MNYTDQDNLIHHRFARRLGELHPDATYACPLEGPRPSRLSKRALVIVLVVAILATLGVLS